tara:strand:+ start:613 stop:774 length:162 start_codon:yes stop_codon:yes gene_type:complete
MDQPIDVNKLLLEVQRLCDENHKLKKEIKMLKGEMNKGKKPTKKKSKTIVEVA